MPVRLRLFFSLLMAAQLSGTPSWGQTAVATAVEDPQASLEGYELRWADEFDEDGPPSPANWGFERGFRRNKEAQWYQPDNAFCERGLLVIEARRERVKVDPTVSERPALDWAVNRTHAEYTSASLNTRGKHEWRYGRFVMRAKIPAVEGAWPAFWTLGSGPWPACGEIDIMEYYDNSLLANVAWLGKGGAEWKAVKKPIHQFGGPSWSEAFHEWRMDWDKDSIKLYVDDVLLNETDTTAIRNANDEAANPFEKPQYLLVNLAIGGMHGGNPSATALPLRYEIDYVRVYQRSNRQVASAP